MTLFHFDSGRQSFEDLGKPNGATHWREEDVMQSLGYTSVSSFRKVIMRAKQACLTLNLHCEEHIALQPDGSHYLTRFGCYLVAMNGDNRKPEVAAAQVYFATLAQTFQTSIEHADGIDRMLIRDEVTDGHKSLSITAKAHGVVNYAYFQNKGFMGMYNMNLERLTRFKGVPSGKRLVDYMGKTELAAHLFRITQTDEKIKKSGIRGQGQLEQAAFEVGKRVRQMMQELSHTTPEDLPISESVNDVKKKLKGTSRNLKAIDGKKKPKPN
jgi:DNA-damage-inducible protein D